MPYEYEKHPAVAALIQDKSLSEENARQLNYLQCIRLQDSSIQLFIKNRIITVKKALTLSTQQCINLNHPDICVIERIVKNTINDYLRKLSQDIPRQHIESTAQSITYITQALAPVAQHVFKSLQKLNIYHQDEAIAMHFEAFIAKQASLIQTMILSNVQLLLQEEILPLNKALTLPHFQRTQLTKHEIQWNIQYFSDIARKEIQTYFDEPKSELESRDETIQHIQNKITDHMRTTSWQKLAEIPIYINATEKTANLDAFINKKMPLIIPTILRFKEHNEAKVSQQLLAVTQAAQRRRDHGTSSFSWPFFGSFVNQRRQSSDTTGLDLSNHIGQRLLGYTDNT